MDLQSGRTVIVNTLREDVVSMAFSSDGKRIALALDLGDAVIREADTGRELVSIAWGDPLYNERYIC